MCLIHSCWGLSLRRLWMHDYGMFIAVSSHSCLCCRWPFFVRVLGLLTHHPQRLALLRSWFLPVSCNWWSSCFPACINLVNSAVIDWALRLGSESCFWHCKPFSFVTWNWTMQSFDSLYCLMLFKHFCQVLECFEMQPQNDLFLDLIPLFPKVFIKSIRYWLGRVGLHYGSRVKVCN